MIKKNAGIMQRKHWVWFVVFIIFVIASMGGIFSITGTENTWQDFLAMNRNFLLILFISRFISLFSESLSMHFLGRGLKVKIPMRMCFAYIGIKFFFNTITPFTAGGQPFIIYYLSRKPQPFHQEVSIGAASVIVLMRIMQYNIVQLLVVVSSMMWLIVHEDRFGPSIHILYRPFIGAVIMLCIVLLVLGLSLARPALFIGGIHAIARVWHIIRPMKDIHQFYARSIHELWHLRDSFRRYFRNIVGIKYLIASFIVVCILYTIDMSALWLIVRGLHFTVDFHEGFVLASVMQFLVSLQPTPGSAGLGDAIFVTILGFSGIPIAVHTLGIITLLWRFSLQYFACILGGCTLLYIKMREFYKKKK